MKLFIALMLPLALVGSLACKKEAPPTPAPTLAPVTLPPTTLPAPVSVSLVTLGNAVGADKRVTAPAETFAPKDTIYAVVETTGTGHAKLRALWTFVRGEKTAKVDETTIELDAAGPTVNEFHVSKPSGWPKGDYKVEIFLNDSPTPAVTRTFKVA
jgi:hypothetical protein